MNFEQRVLELVGFVTDVRAYFFNGTMFLETDDSEIAVKVFDKIHANVTKGLIFGKCGQSETFYDFV